MKPPEDADSALRELAFVALVLGAVALGGWALLAFIEQLARVQLWGS